MSELSIKQPKSLLGIPRSSRPRALKLVLAFAAVALLSGCAETQRLMAKEPGAEAFLARAAAAYGVQPPTLIVDSAMPNGWSARISAEDGRIHIAMTTLGFPDWKLKKVLAHEFSHLLLHNYTRNLSPEIENETDAQAVEVLEKADGLSERDAFRYVYNWHGGARVLHGEIPPAETGLGHGGHCEAIAYLLGRYPAQTSWAKRCGEVAAALAPCLRQPDGQFYNNSHPNHRPRKLVIEAWERDE